MSNDDTNETDMQIHQEKMPRRRIAEPTRLAVYYFLANSVIEGKLPFGSFVNAAKKFDIHEKSVRRIWAKSVTFSK